MHHPLERFPFANFNNFRALGQVHQLQGFDMPINAISTMILIPVGEKKLIFKKIVNKQLKLVNFP